ncbi:treslin [Leuresthes tenuis]|uniref:treslin n=1 Tax=Leuresthes tenuis TaxID=355514 RepID=UPI003B50558D
MALHNLVFVIDIDCEDHESGDRLEIRNQFIKRGILHILLHFGYTYGFEKVRWGYKFFQSKTGRNGSIISKVSDFKELRYKTYEDFEQEFEVRFDVKDKVCPSHQNQQSSQCVSVHNVLKETLLDFQWDRPDITSPTKVTLRTRKSGRGGKLRLSQEDDISNNGRNVVFVVSQCPLSGTQLVDYLSLKDDCLPTDVTEYILSKSLKEMLVQRQVVLHWIDSNSHIQVGKCEDYLGSDKLSQVLAQVGGRVIPFVALLNLCCNQQSNSGFTREAFAFKSSIGYLLSSERLYRLSFPAVGGVLRWDQGHVMQSCGVTLEPVSRRQRLLQESVEVCLKGVLQGWDSSSRTQIFTESWVLQASSNSDQEAAAFQLLLKELSALGLHMLAEVNDNGSVCSAVFSPQSHSTALLTILQPTVVQPDQLPRTKVIVPVTAETSADLPDVVSSVLGVVYDIMNEDGDGINDNLKDHPIPEWALQEFSHSPVTTSMLETWFPQSDQSGVSSNLMESLRLLHAVPEQREEEELSVVQQELISGLSELYKTSQDTVNKRGKKRGAHRTPVKQKMKTMSRSLQMLNVARLNVKAQKNQTETEQLGTEGRAAERPGKKRLCDKSKSGGASTVSFSTEAELLAYLKTCYDKTVPEIDSSLLVGVKQLLAAVKTFLAAESDLEVKTSMLVQQHLLKTSKSVRQLYSAAADVDCKVRECQLQVVLRLELCKLFASKPSDSLDVDQMAEEAAEMLRIISLTKDPVCLARFLQDEILPGFLNAVPRVLADIYHSLGTQLPEALVAALPADFFSDESVAKDSISPSASSPPISTRSLVSDGLQDLRNRSASKRRCGMLTRHRSMTESSQSLRQIEMPKRTTRASKSTVSVALEKPVTDLQPQKQETQEVTKVRRNLFNQEIVSPSKKVKLPRSQSVSAVEGLKRKRSHESEERHQLLTKKVCETPLHKQVSSRLLHRQRMGRSSDLTECIVEESPVKPSDDLRRSPRIKKFARRHSNTFYSSSQPRSRNLDRALSASQLAPNDGKICEVSVKTVRSPMRLLFGAAGSPIRPSDQSVGTRATRSRLSTDSSVFESPNKTPAKSPSRRSRTVPGILSPKTSRTPQTPRTPTTPPSSRMRISSVTESPTTSRSGLWMSLRGSPFRSPPIESHVVETPTKLSPLKGILRTPIKTLEQPSCSSGLCQLSSPGIRTPKKSVTWSPSPQKCRVLENNSTFKVPESPNTASPRSLRPVKTPDKLSSAIQSKNTKRDIFKTPDKFCQVSLLRMCEQTFATPEKNLRSSEKPNRTKTLEKCGTVYDLEKLSQQSTQPSDQRISPQLNTGSPAKTPSPAHQMVTRSGRTPGKSDPAPAPHGSANHLESSGPSVMSPAKSLSRTTFCQGGRTSRHSLSSQSGESLTSELKNTTKSAENLVDKNVQLHTKEEVPAETLQSSETDSSLHTESQEFDSSRGNSATTDDDSLDIVDAAVVNTQFSGGLKMNISFTRKPSVISEDCVSNAVSPKRHVPSQCTPARNYGFRQTPDRQQRKAAARLGYGNDSPRFSTPRGLAGPSRPKGKATSNALTYQVELEMQTSGLPKLKIKRTDSVNADDFSSDGGPRSGGQSPLVSAKPYTESPLALISKHRDPGCVSPSVCAHVTPAKSTPGKGGSVQTYICQSYTPTQHPAATMSPMATADIIPLTPSPQSVGKVTPDNLNSWPRRKKAQIGVLGFKERGLKGEPQLEELLEEAELGVSRLQDFEDTDEPSSSKTEEIAVTSKQLPSVGTDVCPLSPLEDLYWMEKLSEQTGCSDPQRVQEEILWTFENEDKAPIATPPSSKARKPVTASGILALTQSPFLFKGKTRSARKTPLFKDEAASGTTEAEGEDHSPFRQPIRHSNTGKTHSRKRLLH